MTNPEGVGSDILGPKWPLILILNLQIDPSAFCIMAIEAGQQGRRNQSKKFLSLPTCFYIFYTFNPCCLTDCCIFYQSAALPPLAAPAQTWKPKTAKMNTFTSTAAAASVQIHIGSALLVFLIQQLELEHGSQYHFALQEDVAARVSAGKKLSRCFFLDY